MRKLFIFLLIFRIFNSFLVQTYFQADEFWQSLEIAHKRVFGFGYTTWDWNFEIRGFAYPFLFEILFRLLKMFNLDGKSVLVRLESLQWSPKILQSVFAATTDFYTFKVAEKHFGKQVGFWSLFSSMVNWFNLYTSTRTFVNCTETTFTTIALYFWPFRNDLTHLEKALGTAALACIMRPTNVILWIILGIDLLRRASKNQYLYIFRIASRVAVLAISLMIAIDAHYYGHVVFTPYNFYHYNVTLKISEFYGSNPWHWYFSQGVFVILGTFSIPFVIFLLQNHSTSSPSNILIRLIQWTLIVYSFLKHKEFRFILPLLPVMLILSSIKLAQWNNRKFAIFLLITNIPFALYMITTHQQAPLKVVKWLHNHPIDSVHFLMPCHSTPWQSHIHKDKPMKFITCEPPLQGQKHYLDESDYFYKDPSLFLWTRYSKQFGNKTLTITDFPGTNHISRSLVSNRILNGEPWPSHLVFFEGYTPVSSLIKRLALNSNYLECARFFNSHWHEDLRRRGHVLIYCLSK